ncbi:MAG TPA: methylmalonyl-CoA epimerase [Candidatus Marinimicrobia bacterium]|jgi:methylmalonyl-CoA/ethylmalonyl-CoA epimerase|nr:methylmalonyl-CoA epimerase [Candidatus Neomarinimicrobiota bacterium]
MPKLPFKILGIEHVGIAVKDLNSISEIFGELLGLDLQRREKVDDQQVITDIYHAGKDKLEFLKATSPDSPIAKFLGKRPEGMHHIALIVDDIQSALNYLNENDVQLIDSSPRIGAEGLQVAFIHPKSTGGVLVELCEKK